VRKRSLISPKPKQGILSREDTMGAEELVFRDIGKNSGTIHDRLTNEIIVEL
jgi:hypothetical protein